MALFLILERGLIRLAEWSIRGGNENELITNRATRDTLDAILNLIEIGSAAVALVLFAVHSAVIVIEAIRAARSG